MKIPNDPLDLPALFKGLRVEELSVLDLGSGRLDSPLSIHMRNLPFRTLVLVESWLRSVRELTHLKDAKQIKAQQVLIWPEDIRKVVRREKAGMFDVITLLDIVEHLTKPEGLQLLERCMILANKRVLVWIPIGDCPQSNLEGNPWQEHQATWEVDTLEQLGFEVKLYKEYHKHFDPPVSAAWAVWDRQESLMGEEQRKFHGVDLTVKFTDEKLVDTILNDESILATEEEAKELRKQYEDPGREA